MSVKKRKIGVVVFPGSNCDRDCYHVLKNVLGQDVKYIWHKDKQLGKLDAVILPGGFSYGDYLRCGAIARFSPIMKEIVRFAKKGGKVLGICNGFQILVEAGLLPGVLTRNIKLKFLCRDVYVKAENNNTPFTKSYEKGEIVRMPIAHMEGNYFADDVTLKEMNDNNQIVFRYIYGNPNGSLEGIAGVCNKKRNVMGMMPHPERCSEAILENTDGLKVFQSLVES